MIGSSVLSNNTTGSQNTAVGWNALNGNTIGGGLTAVGSGAGQYDVTGSNNTYLGYSAGQTSGLNASKSTAIGNQATITASNQVVLGTSTEGVYIPGSYLAIGGTYSTSSSRSALEVTGNSSFSGAATFSSSTASTFSTNPVVTTDNSGNVTNALATVAYVNAKAGSGSNTWTLAGTIIYPTTLTNKVAIGKNTASTALDVSGDITASGQVIGNSITASSTVNGNAINATSTVNGLTIKHPTGGVVIGTGLAPYSLNSSNNTTILGDQVLKTSNGGAQNTGIGWSALSSNINGSNLTALGSGAGASDANGSSNTYIGYNADSSQSGASKSTAIGYSSQITASNQVVLGTNAEGVYIPGSYLGIGGTYNTNTNRSALEVNGKSSFSGVATFSSSTASAFQTNPVVTSDTSGNVTNSLATVAYVNAKTAGSGGSSGWTLDSGNATLIAATGTTSYKVIIGKASTATTSYNLDVTGSAFISQAINNTTMKTQLTSLNTMFGYSALNTQNVTAPTTAVYNTAIGYNTLKALATTSTSTYNTALGYQAGYLDVSANKNTYLGANTKTDNSTAGYTQSTAIGYGATISDSNQIVLGTSSEKVSIPGSYLGIGGYNPNGGYGLEVNTSGLYGSINTTGGIRVGSSGIFLDNGGSLTMSTTSSINTSGGTINTSGGTINTSGGSINTSGGAINTTGGINVGSGGIFFDNGGNLTMSTTSGISMSGGSITMSGGSINTSGGSITMSGGSINTSRGSINTSAGGFVVSNSVISFTNSSVTAPISAPFYSTYMISCSVSIAFCSIQLPATTSSITSGTTIFFRRQFPSGNYYSPIIRFIVIGGLSCFIAINSSTPVNVISLQSNQCMISFMCDGQYWYQNATQ